MPVKAKKVSKRNAAAEKGKQRLWLMYPPKLITSPIVWELIARFKLKANIRQTEVSGEIGNVCLELEGERSSLKKVSQWLERKGGKVAPVETSVVPE